MSYLKFLTRIALAAAAAAAISSSAAADPVEQKAVSTPPAEQIDEVTGRPMQPPPPEELREKPNTSLAEGGVSALKSKMISISARNSPLRDVIYTVAETTSLNVIMEKGVNPETPVTISLKDMSAGEVLETVLSSVDYFYTIDGNMLSIKLLDTKIFEFGQPSVIQEYSVEVGGDMLGGAKAGSSGVSGAVVQKVQSDKDSFKFWDSTEKTIAAILGKGSSEGAPPFFSVNRMTGAIVVTATKKDLARVEQYLKDYNTNGLDIRILAPVEATRASLERVRAGERFRLSYLFRLFTRTG